MMKAFLWTLLILISNQANSFTLTDSNLFRFDNSDNIVINVAEDGCSSAGGYTPQEILDMAVHGAEMYWNTVETANVRFVAGSIISGLSANGLDLSAFYLNTVGQARNQVYIGCSSAVPSAAVAYATSRGSDKNLVGLVLYKDTADNFARDFDTTSAILAHELGHTLGLGHSRYNLSLMDPSGGARGLNKLTQDDRDGLTYLYPHDKSLGGCLGSIGSIKDISKDKHPPINPQGPISFLITTFLVIMFLQLMMVIKKKFKLVFTLN